jgi:uncharacterized protein YbbC (DUF1343 family)
MAMVTNDAATSIDGTLSRAALLKNRFKLVRIFSPEHGITVKGDDGVLQHNSRDIVTGLPVISLYSEKLSPSEEELLDLDLVLFDIPDVGCRFYTYLWTMTYVMEACAKYGKPFMVLDRPNPIGAALENAEGPMLDELNCSSFIGRWNIPLKHCCTLGELAMYFASTRLPTLSIEVIKAGNYERHQSAGRDFEFIPTSPAIRNIHTAMLYPGTGLWEGIQVNEGRGSHRPFEQIGAPWMQGDQLCDALSDILKNVSVTPVQYIPESGVYANESCNGIALNITKPSAYMSVSSGILMLQTIMQLYPEEARERLYTTNANPAGERHMDKQLGCINAYERLKRQENMDISVSEQWYKMIQPCLLYS